MTRSSPAPAPHSMKKLHRPGPAPQRGAAALIVVLLLFFVISLVAAYAGRNLIFEQRTSTNQYRATQAFEAAEAGLEWAVAMLNGGRVTAECIPPSPVDVTQPSFRQRYLDDRLTATRAMSRRCAGPTALRPNGPAACATAPAGTAVALQARRPTPAVPAGGGVHPAFRVCFEAVDPPQPGVVRVVSTGRTSFVDQALRRTWRRHRRRCRRDRERGRRVEQRIGDTAQRGAHRARRSGCRWRDATAALACRRRHGISKVVDADGWLAHVPADHLRRTTWPSDVRGTPIKATMPTLSGLSDGRQMFASMFGCARRTTRRSLPRCVLDDCAVACRDKLGARRCKPTRAASFGSKAT